MTDKILVFSNCGSSQEAENIARALLEKHLAACVNILPGVRSLYHWQGKIEEAQEWMLVIKSSRAAFAELSSELRKVHSYEVPEVVAVPVVESSDAYLDWLSRELTR